MSPFETRRLRFTVLIGMLALMGCLSNRDQAPTIWPPEDFYLEIEGSEVSAEGLQVTQRLQVWADGLLVYQEADRSLRRSGSPLQLPLFERMCAYRLHPESVRALSRQIGQLRIDELATDQGGGAGEGELQSIHVKWFAFARQKLLYARGRARLPLARLLRAVNSFLPQGHAFSLPRMGGEPEDSRVEQVPPLVEGLDSALAGYTRVLRLRAEDPNLLLSAYALAVDGAGRKRATELLDRLRVVLAAASQESEMFPEARQKPLIQQLEELLGPGQNE